MRIPCWQMGRCLVGRGHRVTVFTTVANDLESLWVRGYKTFPAEQFSPGRDDRAADGDFL